MRPQLRVLLEKNREELVSVEDNRVGDRTSLKINHSEVKLDLNTKRSMLGLLHDRVRLDESFPMGPCSTSGDENSLRYDVGPHHCDCHVSTQ
jgi:hypothetical protein